MDFQLIDDISPRVNNGNVSSFLEIVEGVIPVTSAIDSTELELDLWSYARCNDGTGHLVALFFSEQLDDIARAKAFCGECPVKEACFTDALARREPAGVWGGRYFYKGKVQATKRPRGRPRKNEAKEPAAAVVVTTDAPLVSTPPPVQAPEPVSDEQRGLLADLVTLQDYVGGSVGSPGLDSLHAQGFCRSAEQYRDSFGTIARANRLARQLRTDLEEAAVQ